MPDVTPAARRLRTLWGAITAGGLGALVALSVLGAMQAEHPLASRADAAFYVCALYSVAALGVAFWLVGRMERRAAEAPSESAALGVVRTTGVAAMAAVESSAILAGAAVFLTGNVMAAAYGVPLVAFAWLTWPTDARVARWLGSR